MKTPKNTLFEHWLNYQFKPIYKTIDSLKEDVNKNTIALNKLRRKINNSNKRIRELEQKVANLENGGNNND